MRSAPQTTRTGIHTLSLHDALPIYEPRDGGNGKRQGGLRPSRIAECRPPGDDPPDRSRARARRAAAAQMTTRPFQSTDRKSTRLNSSHSQISYAVFCLKKKNLT